ncbi:MAG: peroxiredoxin [Clostridiales bacterium]|uniref:peroxiredoxin n=1 Tax=Terrisporobacter sp. TaxID=1965305 RepID=UPI002A5704E1|nr:peroxiredoxin [Clostridium sp.]MCI6459055.1 peroxiredoxin [Clostridium sp.]MCI7207887.1 peroxiredoxin [Clostridium sp.]MDD7755774.1 peroxiredoxin [Clostridiales bacterium]
MTCLPNLGEKAPNFKANTTFGPIELSDYTGKWVVLFSHPGDFTPVCTTEFIAFTNLAPEFDKRNTKLIGLSVDSNASHLAWVYNILQMTGVTIPFPIIEDRDMKIAKKYGMISESVSNISTVRTVFIIDDKQILRTILYYPLTTGRNIPEILRIVEALQTADKCKVVTPANWLPGTPVLLPPPKTYKELLERVNNCNKEYKCLDWYICFIEDECNKCRKRINSSKKSINKNNFLKRPPISKELTPDTQNPNCPNLAPIVMEYVLGNPKNIDIRFLDAIIYAFVEIDSSGNLVVPAPSFLRSMVRLKEEKPELLVIAAIGGWAADGFSDAALTPTSRYNFARNVQKLINDYKLDGIDLDWEYPGSSASGIKSRPQDRENFTLLITALRDVLGPNTWISVAGTGDSTYINNSVEIDKIAPLITHFNLMSYDFTAGETGSSGQKHQANLYDSALSLPGYSTDRYVRNLINAGMPSEKILLGVPFYGRLGATITKSYDELRKSYINKDGYEYRFDNDAKVPYLVRDGEFAMSFDNEVSIFLKAQYVLENCLGGIFSWQSTFDQANILARAMYESINNPVGYAQELEDTFGPIPQS